MKYTDEHLTELNVLLQFDFNDTTQGIKVHQDAHPETKDAIKRLFDKNLCTLPDGGYLTHEGIEMAQNAYKMLRVLSKQ